MSCIAAGRLLDHGNLPLHHDRDVAEHVNCTTCTATLALQLELKVVVVVGAKFVIAADPIIEHANTPNVYKGTGCN